MGGINWRRKERSCSGKNLEGKRICTRRGGFVLGGGRELILDFVGE